MADHHHPERAAHVILSALLDRACRSTGLGTVYALGSGAPPNAPVPGGHDGCCDCSGWIAWLFGYERYQPHFGFLQNLNGGWMSTEGICADAEEPTGLWESVQDAIRPGLVVVYPGRAYAQHKLYTGWRTGPKIGHVGLVTKAGANTYKVTHCSMGNWHLFGDAIKETGPEVFERVPYRRFVRFSGLTLGV